MPRVNIFSDQLKNDDVFRWLAFGIIALAVLVSYFPTLYFPPRADQVTYLADIAQKHDPFDLIIGCYDIHRHRVYAPGDEILFRPILFMLLGAEQVVFGHHFWAWQLLGICAHLTLLWVLLRLLWHLSGPWLGFAGAWVYALSVSNYEQVSWPHLTSYIFMMVFIILTVEQLVHCFEENEFSMDRFRRMLIYLSISCFIYETVNLFILCMVGVLFISFPKHRIRTLALVIPVVFYVSWSYLNYVYVNHVVKETVHHGVAIGKYLWSVIYVSAWWLYEGLFNGMYGYMMAIRTMFNRNEVLVFKPLVFNNVQVMLELIILSAFAGLAWISRRSTAKRIKLLVILSGMLFAYTAVLVVGRYEEMGSLRQAVRINSYYLYLFWAIVVMMAFSLLSAKEKYTGIGQWFVAVFVMASLILGISQGKTVYSISSLYGKITNNTLLLVTTLDLLIREKGQEPGFSFYVDPEYAGNYTYGEVTKKGGPHGKKYTFTELLYPQYSRPRETAKYKFLIKKPDLHRDPASVRQEDAKKE